MSEKLRRVAIVPYRRRPVVTQKNVYAATVDAVSAASAAVGKKSSLRLVKVCKAVDLKLADVVDAANCFLIVWKSLKMPLSIMV